MPEIATRTSRSIATLLSSHCTTQQKHLHRVMRREPSLLLKGSPANPFPHCNNGALLALIAQFLLDLKMDSVCGVV